MRPILPLLALLCTTLAMAAGAPGKVVLTSGRAVPAIAYEVLTDQVKVTQPDHFVLYLPLEQVDLGATAASLGKPGPPPKPGEMRTLWIKAPEKGGTQNQVGVVESLETWKRAHAGSSGGSFSAPSGTAAVNLPEPVQEETPSGSRIERDGQAGPPVENGSEKSPPEERRRELSKRLYDVRTHPEKYSRADIERLQDEMDKYDQELYERQQKAWGRE
jgi:hypothetical protein